MLQTPLFWLECDESDLPVDESWLSELEIACFRERWVPQRRRDWILGRWAAKCALAACAHPPVSRERFRDVAILPTRSGAPIATMCGKPLDVSLSMSHRDGRALVVLAAHRVTVGCDLEIVEPHSRAFLEQFFTNAEIQQVDHLDPGAWCSTASLIWSAKESVLKLLAVGLRVDTRCVSVSIDVSRSAAEGWQHFSALLVDGRSFKGWWQRDVVWLRTIVGTSATAPPTALSKVAVTSVEAGL